MLVLLPFLGLLCAPALLGVLAVPRFLRDSQPTSPQPAPTLSVLIPARDEEANLPNLLASLATQSLAPYEIIVIDDHSTDATAKIASEAGATVLSAEALPSGWKGKPWACQQGADHAKGDIFLFLDADTTLEPQALEHLSAASSQGAKVISVCPYHLVPKAYEQLSCFFNLLMVTGVGAFGARQNAYPAHFGQCLWIDRKTYAHVGGHAAVKSETLENFHLAQHLRQQQIPSRALLGKGLISMRMFPGGISELWNSWKKGCIAGASHAPKSALVFSSIWISGAMFSIVSLALLPFHLADPAFVTMAVLGYVIYASQCAMSFSRIGSYRLLSALIYPIFLLFYQALFGAAVLASKRGTPVLWKGREV